MTFLLLLDFIHIRLAQVPYREIRLSRENKMSRKTPNNPTSKCLDNTLKLHGYNVCTLFLFIDSKSLQSNSWGSLCCGFTALWHFRSLRVSLYVRTNVSDFLQNNQHRANHSIPLPLPLPLLILQRHTQLCTK